jgi:hypothetical protein
VSRSCHACHALRLSKATRPAQRYIFFYLCRWLAIRILQSYKLMFWHGGCNCSPPVTWWGLVQRRVLVYLIVGLWAESVLVFLSSQIPVVGEIDSWGVFPTFGDVLHTFRIWRHEHMGSLGHHEGLHWIHTRGRRLSCVVFWIVLSAILEMEQLFIIREYGWSSQ